MKVPIVYAHPEPLSFNGALKNLAVEVLTQAGHFRPGVRPVRHELRSHFFSYQREQIGASKAGLFFPELKAEMDKLVWADFVIFQFPLWWFSVPAILKSWVDRVFAMGFSYNYGRSYEKAVFEASARCFVLQPGVRWSSTQRRGATEHFRFGAAHPAGDVALYRMDVLPPFIAYGAARVVAERRAAHLEEYRGRLLSLDSTLPIEFEKAQ